MSSRATIAGNLCGLFAIVAVLAAVWLGVSTIWDARQAIWDAIRENPAATVFWTATVGFAASFAYGLGR
jgi:hypothetical protein